MYPKEDYSYIPITIIASNRTFNGTSSCVINAINRGTIPWDITEPFCRLLPITAFFKQINAS